MYTDIYAFSNIVDSDKGIRLHWIGTAKDNLYNKYGYHTGIDLYTNNVYSYSPGVVIISIICTACNKYSL